MVFWPSWSFGDLRLLIVCSSHGPIFGPVFVRPPLSWGVSLFALSALSTDSERDASESLPVDICFGHTSRLKLMIPFGLFIRLMACKSQRLFLVRFRMCWSCSLFAPAQLSMEMFISLGLLPCSVKSDNVPVSSNPSNLGLCCNDGCNSFLRESPWSSFVKVDASFKRSGNLLHTVSGRLTEYLGRFTYFLAGANTTKRHCEKISSPVQDVSDCTTDQSLESEHWV